MIGNNMAEVSFSLTKVKNLGDYETVRIQVGLTMTCENTKDAVDRTYNKINKYVNRRVEEEEDQWEE